MAHLLRERISLRRMCRAVGVSLTGLLHFMVACFASCPDHGHGRLPASPAKVLLYKLEAEADAMGSCVQKRANKPWMWLAMDATTRQMIAVHVGDRRRASAKALWNEILEVDQAYAIFHTDPYEVYNGVMLAERHTVITKQARNTNHIERFNNILRQRLLHLVCATLSFLEKVENHIGAIKCFICHSNLEKAAAFPV